MQLIVKTLSSTVDSTYCVLTLSEDRILRTAIRGIYCYDLHENRNPIRGRQLLEMVYFDQVMFCSIQPRHLAEIIGEDAFLILERTGYISREEIISEYDLKYNHSTPQKIHISPKGFYWSDEDSRTRFIHGSTLQDWASSFGFNFCDNCGEKLAKGFNICTDCDPEA